MPTNAREIFTKRLVMLMERRGITQADIARELGVATGTVSMWFNGARYPRIDTMQRLADYLGVTLEVLTTENGLSDLEDADRLEALHQNPRLGLLFDRQRNMKPEDIEFMLQMADRIVKERDSD